MIFSDSPCALCFQALGSTEPVFSTWGVWLEESDPLCGYCDTGMHWRCYADWPQRPRFARSYFEFWVENEKTDAIWHKAWLDEYALVTVNSDPIIHSAWVHLSETGERISVKLREWADWIVSIETGLPAAVSESVNRAKRAMLPQVPNGEALVANIDWETKGPILEGMRAEWKAQRKAERDRQRRIQPKNAAVNRLVRQVEKSGMVCPACQSTIHECMVLSDEIYGKGSRRAHCPECGEELPTEEAT